jgi:hypothetical protein
MAPPRKTAQSKAEEVKANSRVGKVNLEDLQIDPSYQRTPSPQLVETIEQNWDEVASELLLVSDRGNRNGADVTGGLFLVNGQHRSLAAKRLGVTQLDARFIDLTEEKDPAAIEARFRLTTNVGLRDRATERFKAQLRAGDAESVDIVRILAQCGTEIMFNPADEFGITAISTVEQIYRFDDTGALLRETLELIKESFGGYTEKAQTAAMLKAIAWFIVVHMGQADLTRLRTKLGEVQSLAVDRRARTIQGTMAGALWFNYYRAIVDIYNERLQERSRLEWISRGARALGGKTERGTKL